MPVRKDASTRRIELTFELPGSPEQVWRAIATGPGISSWFVPSEVEQREGGAVKFQIAPGMDSQGRVTKWQPPHHFAYEEPIWSEGAPPLGTEFIVEARDGSTCTVRLVHSLFTSSDAWDDEIEGMEKGWGPFFQVLRLYLEHFPDQKSASVRPTGNHPGSPQEAGDALLSKLGVAGPVAGARFETTASGAPRLLGEVEKLPRGSHSEVLVRLQEPSTGVALTGAFRWGEQTQVAVSLFFYGEDAARIAAEQSAVWTAWMQQHFP